MTRRLVDQARRVKERIDAERATAEEAVLLRRNIEVRLHPRRRASWLLLAPAAAAAVVVLLLLWPQRGWYDVVSGAACVSQREAGLMISADCGDHVRLRAMTAEMDMGAGSELRREPDALRLVRGRTDVRVDPRATKQPFRMRVSHGVIVARGTLFTVEQGEVSGHVDLHSGEISFTWNDGSGTDILAPGQSLAWPRAQAVEPPAPDESAGPPPRRGGPGAALPEQEASEVVQGEPIGDVLRRLSQLGSQRRYAESAALLRQAVERPDFTPEQRERLSFELGLVLADKLNDRAAACAHWRTHVAAFPSGVRSERVRELLRACP